MDHETKIRKVLFNEVSFGIAVVGAILSIVFWVVNPQADLQIQIVKLQAQIENNETVGAELSKIKNNDLHEMNLSIGRLEERDIQILQALARIEALIKK